jgi:hypothetical protein
MPAGNVYTGGSGITLDSRDIVADFYPRLEASMESIWAPRISLEIPSTREVEELAWLGQVPTMVRWIGGRNEEFLNKYTLSVRNYEYEATLPISVPDLRRDKSGQLRQRVGDLAVRTATHWNKLIGEWVTAGEAGTKGLAYDGQFFFDTDHNESGTNQTNDLTATEVPSANVATTSTLTTTEAAGIITETLAYMMSLTDDRGEPINAQPTEVLILATKPGTIRASRRRWGSTTSAPAREQQPGPRVERLHDQRAVRPDPRHGGGQALLLLRWSVDGRHAAHPHGGSRRHDRHHR